MRDIKNRLGIFLAAAVLALSCTGGSGLPRGSRMNIMILVLDAGRADHFGCYGYERPTTPNIDRIAAEGVRFSKAFSTSSWTLPSHASLFTGLLPDEHNTTSRHAWLLSRIPTLAELLSAQGYRTGGFSNNPFVSRSQNLHRGFERFEAVWADTTVTDSVHPYDTPHTNKLVEAFLDSCAGGDRPFFAFVNYMDTHMPYNPPEPYRGKYLENPPADSARMDSLCRYSDHLNSGALVPNEREREAMEAIYDGGLTYLDSRIGELLDFMRGKALLDSTLLIVLSDHGEVFGEKGMYTHGIQLYRPLVQIALIARCPALITEPSVRDEAVSITDVFFSIARLTAVSGAPSGAAGRYLFGGEIEPQECYSKLYAGREAVQSRSGKDLFSLVSAGGKHMIYCPETSWECYDLQSDAFEESNMVPSLVSRAAVERDFKDYGERLLALVESREDLAITDSIKVEDQQVHSMRALGYVGGSAGPASATHPHTAEHLTNGIRCYLRGDYTEAETELRSALALESNNREVRQYLGFTLYRLNRLEEAAGVLGSLAGTGQDSPLVLAVLGKVLESMGKHDEALRQYMAYFKLKPDDVSMVLQTVRMLLEAGRDSTADALADALFDSAGDNPEALDAATGIYLTAGRWSGAERLLQQAVKFGRTQSRLNNLALCAVRLNDKAAARGYLRELLKMAIPERQRANYELQLKALD